MIKKEKISITLDKTFKSQIDRMVTAGTFSSISHALDVFTRKFFEDYGPKKRY